MVQELGYENFYDLKDLSTKSGFNVLKNEKNDAVKISDITMLRVEKESPHKVFYKTSFSDADFHIIEIKKPRSSSSRKISDLQSSIIADIKPLYSAKQKIKADKKGGLLKLLNKNLIPKSYLNFYTNL